MMNARPKLFSKRLVTQKLRRAAPHYEDYNFILQWAARELLERLGDIKRTFQNILILSPRQADSFERVFPDANVTILPYDALIADPEDVLDAPLGDEEGYDLILSIGDLHKVNDLLGVLICLRQMLKPDGVLMACFPGGETLRELRFSLMQAEIQTMGGASQRVLPFADKQQVGALMQRAGYALPVVDSETLHVSYRDIFHLMHDLRGMGETNCLLGRYKFITPTRLFFEAAQIYAKEFAEKDGRLPASFEVIFTIGWAPHDSQQKPAKRGSAQVNLNEIL